jgi:hypothetical protein
VTDDESLELLQARWPAVVDTVAAFGGVPEDLSRDGLMVLIRMRSRTRCGPDGKDVHDEYVFRLNFTDYDEHAPRIVLCNPADPAQQGNGKQFYPRIEGNNVFNHDTFFCMPGDRRCYEQGNHMEWKQKHHFHPDVVINSLYALIQSPHYKGRM